MMNCSSGGSLRAPGLESFVVVVQFECFSVRRDRDRMVVAERGFDSTIGKNHHSGDSERGITMPHGYNSTVLFCNRTSCSYVRYENLVLGFNLHSHGPPGDMWG